MKAKAKKMTTKKLGFGLMRLPLTNPDDNKSIDIPAFIKMADAFIANGFTYFDTAYPYHGGCSETAFKAAVVDRYPRNAFTVTDKMPMFLVKEASQLPEFFNQQLQRCGVEYFDYYWLHALGKESYETVQKTDAFAFISQMKALGRIKHIGFSFHDTPETLDRILTDHPETEYVQLQINYLDWNDTAIRARECYEVAVKHKKPVIVMEPVKGGALADLNDAAAALLTPSQLSVASWAVRYAASMDNVLTVLSGMSNQQQVEDNISYMRDFVPLTQQENAMLERVADAIAKSTAVPCTACRYCSACPQNIAIPEYFSAYNNLKRFGRGQRMVAVTYYENIAKTHGKASECIGCGACEDACPQHLQIRNLLQKVAEELEE